MRLVARSFAQYQEDGKIFKKYIISEHLSLLSAKPLHGQLRETANTVSNTSQWTWLRKGNFTKELEGLICAAQEQALSTNACNQSVHLQLTMLS